MDNILDMSDIKDRMVSFVYNIGQYDFYIERIDVGDVLMYIV